MFDVIVAGGGPAGLAVASALSGRGHSVAVLERTSYERPRPGETLDAETFPLLQALGAWGSLAAFVDNQVPHRAVRAAWGTDELEDKPSILHPLGEGRHVQRARFDETLATWAESAGVLVRKNAGRCVVTRRGEAFHVTAARGNDLESPYFVDASGRGAPASAKLRGRRWLGFDREVAIVAVAEPRGDPGFDLLLEASQQGWWYSVPQPDGTLIAALVTDGDLLLTGDRKALAATFVEALSKTIHTAARCEGLANHCPIRVVRADSGLLLPDAGVGWCAIGDAAMSTDPLAGNGVARALRSAIDAAARIDAHLRGTAPPDATPLLRSFADYLDRRASYYELETRWPDSPFWARRRPGAWRQIPINLPPTAMLRRDGKPSREALAPVEALVPPRVIASTLVEVRAATPAHAILSRLREAAPIGDRRLLVALQMLVGAGALAVV